MTTGPRFRFAPSPTGSFHVGGARTALQNWALARRLGGTFVLRIEDTDEARNRPEWTQGIIDALAWIGISADDPHFEGPHFQSEYAEAHLAAAKRLHDEGHATGLGDEGGFAPNLATNQAAIEVVLSVEQCVTPPGFGWQPDGTAAPCPLGFFAPGFDNQACIKCGEGLTTTATQSTSEADCVPLPGWQKKNQGEQVWARRGWGAHSGHASCSSGSGDPGSGASHVQLPARRCRGEGCEVRRTFDEASHC